MASEFNFTLVFKIDGDVDIDELVEHLGAAGCTDALVHLGRIGYLALSFTREAQSLDAARESAIADVKQAIPEAQLAICTDDVIYSGTARNAVNSHIETSSAHVTAVGGNVFEDVGFAHEEAAALQAESRRIISKKLESRSGTCGLCTDFKKGFREGWGNGLTTLLLLVQALRALAAWFRKKK